MHDSSLCERLALVVGLSLSWKYDSGVGLGPVGREEIPSGVVGIFGIGDSFRNCENPFDTSGIVQLLMRLSSYGRVGRTRFSAAATIRYGHPFQ